MTNTSNFRHRAVQQPTGYYYIQVRGLFGWKTIYESLTEDEVQKKLQIYVGPKIIYPEQPK